MRPAGTCFVYCGKLRCKTKGQQEGPKEKHQLKWAVGLISLGVLLNTYHFHKSLLQVSAFLILL